MAGYFETIKNRLFQATIQTGECADEGDTQRNHVNYGVVSAYASVLRDMGHDVDVPVYEDAGKYVRIPHVSIDGVFYLANGRERA